MLLRRLSYLALWPGQLHTVSSDTTDLSPEERRLVEQGFKNGVVRVIAATQTLAAGVNLPAARVILRHHWVYNEKQFLSTTDVQQMSGRAGRPGLNDRGEVILICPPNCEDASEFADLFLQKAQVVQSSLQSKKGALERAMERALSDLVCTGHLTTPQQIEKYVRCTLLHATEPGNEDGAVKRGVAALTWLRDKDILRYNSKNIWEAKPLGAAALAAGMDPAQALAVDADLKQGLETFVVKGDLHLTYLVTPQDGPDRDLLSTVPTERAKPGAGRDSAAGRKPPAAEVDGPTAAGNAQWQKWFDMYDEYIRAKTANIKMEDLVRKAVGLDNAFIARLATVLNLAELQQITGTIPCQYLTSV